MAKFEVWLATWRVGSKETAEVEIPDEDLEGLGGEERERFICEWMEGEIHQLYEWGWREVAE